MLRNLLAAGTLALACTSVYATLIRVTTSIGFLGNTFEPSTLDPERGTMTFVYRTDTPDADPRPNVGLYFNAIQFVGVTVGQRTRPDLDFVLAPGGVNRIEVEPFGFPGEPDPERTVQLNFSVQDLSGAYATPLEAQFTFVDDEKVTIAGGLPDVAFWSIARGLGGSIGPAGDMDAIPGPFVAQVIPAPGSLALLAGGVLAAGLLRRRQGFHPRLERTASSASTVPPRP